MYSIPTSETDHLVESCVKLGDPGSYLREMKHLPNIELLQGFSTHEVEILSETSWNSAQKPKIVLSIFDLKKVSYRFREHFYNHHYFCWTSKIHISERFLFKGV